MQVRLSTQRRLLGALATASLVLAAAACGAGSQDGNAAGGNSAGSDTIRVGTDATYPPYEYKEGGEYTGLELDLIRAAAEELGKEVEFIDVKYTAGIGALNAGRFDVLAVGGTIDSEERQAQVLLVDIFNSSDGLIVEAGNPEGLDTKASLCGHAVSVFQGSAFENSLKSFSAAECGGDPIEILSLSDANGPYDAVTTGKADAYFGGYVQSVAQAEVMGAEAVKVPDGDTYLGGLLVKKDNLEMAQMLAQGMQQAIDAGKIPEIAAKYGITEADIVSEVTINTGKVPVEG